MPEVALHPADSGAGITPPKLLVSTAEIASAFCTEPCWNVEEVDPYLIPERLTWGMNGQISTLTLRFALGKAQQDARDGDQLVGNRNTPEGAVEHYKPGMQVVLEWIRPSEEDGGEPIYQEIFRGTIAQNSVLIQASPDADVVSFTAYGPELRLKQKAVHGQWCKNTTADDAELAETITAAQRIRDNAFIADLPCIFNHKGKPNCSQDSQEVDPDTALGWDLSTDGDLTDADEEKVPDTMPCRCFEGVGRLVQHHESERYTIQATHWTAYRALVSLLAWFDDGENIHLPDVARYASELNTRIPEVVVEGLSLLDAMRAILLPVGYGFCLEPSQTIRKPEEEDEEEEDATPRTYHKLSIFPLHRSAGQAGPNLADNTGGNITMDSDAGVAASVQRLHFLRDSHNVQNEVTVVGDQKRVLAAFTFDNDTGLLKAAWNTSTHDLATYADNDGEIGVVSRTGSVIAADESDDLTADQKQAWRSRYVDDGGDYEEYRNVFRRFAANDDGWLSHLPDGEGHYSIADFSDLEGDTFRRARPLGHTYARLNDTSGFTAAYVEICLVDAAGDDVDDSWILLREGHPFRDHLGFHIKTGRLDALVPYKSHLADSDDPLYSYANKTLATLLKNTLAGSGIRCKFRLVGSLPHDEALTSTVSRSTESTWPWASEQIIYRPESYRCVTNSHAPAGHDFAGEDDSTDIEAFATAAQDILEDAMGHGSLVLRHVPNLSYPPGTPIAQTAGRRIILSVDAGGRTGGASYCPIVAQVICDFTEGACNTELVLETPLLKIMR